MEEISILKELVEINSGTMNHEGVLKVQKIFETLIKELGFKSFWVENKKKLSPPLLILEKGQNPFITLIGHADTVFEKESKFTAFKLSSDKKKAMGPGVLDDKGSLLVAILAVEKLKKESEEKKSLRFIISPSEEIGSIGFWDEYKELSKTSSIVLGLEPAMDNADIIESRKGGKWYDIYVKGIEAHAGRNYFEGSNAAWELAVKIDKLQKLTHKKKNITVNTGHIFGGQNKHNIVCGFAQAKIDARFSTSKDGKELHKRIMEILSKNWVQKKCHTEFELVDDCPAFHIEKKTKPLIEFYLKTISKLENKKIKAISSGGSSDCNYLARPGLMVIDGLGATGGFIHTENEYLELSSLETRSEVLKHLIKIL